MGLEVEEYWLKWQVLVCAVIIILPTAIAVVLVFRRRSSNGGGGLQKAADAWAPCWRSLHPRWLLLYRGFAFAAMAFMLYTFVQAFGFFVFFFYTQWTFALVVVYFALATIISVRGCRIHAKKLSSSTHTGERDKFLKEDSVDDHKYGKTSSSREKLSDGYVELDRQLNPMGHDQQIGYLENILHIVYQTCTGAVMLTDIVFWGLLLPFMSGDDFQLTLLIGLMHSVNAVFLLIDSALNCLPFSWFGLTYFVLWSCVYVVFQWALHACCFTWWPYPFLDLSNSWAPMWYLALALVHLPCYGLYVLLMKAKLAAFSRMFPRAFVRSI